MTKRIAVIGAGVIGLSTTLRLIANLENDALSYVVDVYATKFTPETTSDGAAGLWAPLLLDETPPELIRSWGKGTYDWLRFLMQQEMAGEIGVAPYSGYLYFTKDKFEGDPIYKDDVIGYRRVTAEEMEGIKFDLDTGCYFVSMMMQGNRYCYWLTESLRRHGVNFHKRKVASLSEFSGKYDVVLNCTGLGSYDLLNDHELYPVRGQILKVRAPWIKFFSIVTSEEGYAYCIPCVDYVVIGGTAQKGNWSEEPSAADRKGILDRCYRMIPSLKAAPVVGEWVGLRPARTSVRLEREELQCSTTSARLQVVHNYGHAGAGLTLCWGCAKDAVLLAYQALGISLKHKSSLTNNRFFEFINEAPKNFHSKI